ncbi:MAG: glycosyltransferase family A protein [Lachnospiraceae bacterium]
MRKDFYVYIFIPTHNSIETLNTTVESIERQTYDKERLKVIFIDNASTDGTYQKELAYITGNPIMFSVIRETIPTTNGRLLKKAIDALYYAKFRFYLFLSPGDILYPNSIEQNILLFNLNRTAQILASEVDVKYEDNRTEQQPIFTDNCILRPSVDRIQYYKAGIGHKVQVMFRRRCLNFVIKLPYYAQLAEYNDWISLVFYASAECIYTREKSGCITIKKEKDPITRLINKTFFIKRNFYAAETKVFSTMKADEVELEERSAGYHSLAVWALQYALEEIKCDNHKLAQDCLTYAEMIDLNIVEEEEYQMAVLALHDPSNIPLLEEKLLQDSVEPPKECSLF